MGKLAEFFTEYFRTASKEQLEKDWEELKHLNQNSPNIFKVISSDEYKHLKECEEIVNLESDYGDKHYC